MLGTFYVSVAVYRRASLFPGFYAVEVGTFIDVSGQPVGPIFKGKGAQGDCSETPVHNYQHTLRKTQYG